MSELKPDASVSDLSESTPAVNVAVLVGHCGFDQRPLQRAVDEALPGVQVDAVNGIKRLSIYLRPDALLLVNRVLDGRFTTASGIELIAELARHNAPPRMILISNYPDAQARAKEAGALPGFGKSDLRTPDAVARLHAAAGLPSA